jgi:hypothetical protein
MKFLKLGCCGMAGLVGFGNGKYDVSMQIGEQVLLPRAQHAPANIAILAKGFSYREQIEQTTGRSTMHAAETLHRSSSASW